jgi:hypothetical protein
MNPITLLLLICTALALVAFTWWGSTWWYGRKLLALQQRLDKTREAATQHVGQARRQIAQLQKELVARPPLSALERNARDELAAARSRRAEIEQSLDRSAKPRLPANGFADTQPL